MELKEKIIQKALELGFVRAGIASAEDFTEYFDDVTGRPEYDFFVRDPRQIVQNALLSQRVPEAKSILSVVYSYSNIYYPDKLLKYIGRAYLARCYNPPESNLHGARLRLLKDYIKSLGIHIYEEVFLPDRSVGARAGTVSIGKNNFAYAGQYGSFIILNSILMDAPLEPDEPRSNEKCPDDCTLCLDACPTQAITKPFHLVPQRCIGFNNWSRQDEKGISPVIPKEIRPAIGSRYHGCDACQEVCPRNRGAMRQMQAHSRKDPFLEHISEKFDLTKLLFLDDEYYSEVVEPVMFNYIHNYRYFRRNAALAMGNSGDPGYLPALREASRTETDDMVREMVTWAIGELEKK
jgi:epoxyqueuosine reductase